MAAISGVGSSGGYVPQRPDPAQLASNLFNKLDTNNQGFIDKDQLASALSKNAPPGGAPAGAPSADDIFAKLDGNNDGKLTKQEFTDGVQKLAEQLNGQFDQSRVRRGGGGQQGGPQGADGPPPGGPPPGGAQGAGGPQGAGGSRSADKASDSASSDDPADSNNDGTVSAQELAAYQTTQAEKKAEKQGDSAQQDGNASILRTLFHLARTYGQQETAASQGSLSATA